MSAGPVAVIFGGASGIGLATARGMAGQGTRVVVADVGGVSEEVTALDGVDVVTCDATDVEAVRSLLEAVSGRHAGWMSVVTTVGGAQVRPFETVDLGYWEREMAHNLTSAYVACGLGAEVLRRRGEGAVVAVVSSYGFVPGPDRIAYSAAKAGVVGMARSLALAVARDGVRVNCVAPGATVTDRFVRMSGGPDGVEEVRSATPLGRLSRPEDVAEAIMFLASERCPTITGDVLHVNSGIVMT